MKKYIVVALFLLSSVTGGCSKEETASSTGSLSPSPSLATTSSNPDVEQFVFKPYTDHVAPNPEVMSLEERKKLTPLGQEFVALLDDYVNAFNNNIPQNKNGKFAAVDGPGSVTYGEGVLKLMATDEIKVLNQGNVVTIAAFVEVREKAEDIKPYWSGKQQFRFIQDVNQNFRLGYWNERAE
ncbi:hypothetical protein [Paenibacillus sp. N3.4]|uniref:hypothetical protein n=1 Tax=Paenibacillus sp. N3.4 TaxID=2603222 RepID=UPI0011CBA0FA|nr:hypothetical protein [Paenibacillus sp. N3.4]TXK75886.1 hypothetical protein FU659_26905 [Paenibacillus sp. N3.4]